MATYLIEALVAASGYPARTIRKYIHEGVLPRPAHRGKMTEYDDAFLTRLRAIRKLRDEQTMVRMEDFRAWFANKSPQQVEAFVKGTPAAKPAAPPPPPPAPAPAPLTGDRWTHVALMPGMVLLVREGSPALVTRIAAEIRAKYAAE